MSGPALTVVLATQYAVNHVHVSVGRPVVDKRSDLLERGRQPVHVEIHAANPGNAVGRWRHSQAFGSERLGDERIDRGIDPIIAAWQSPAAPPLCGYERGLWGPAESTDWMTEQDREWFDVCPVLTP